MGAAGHGRLGTTAGFGEGAGSTWWSSGPWAILIGMSEGVEALLAAALRLSREERVELAALLTDLLEDAPSEEIERAWLAEAKHRLEEVRAGRMRTIAAEEVEQKLWDMLERGRPRAVAAG